jgi:hypothetical protein
MAGWDWGYGEDGVESERWAFVIDTREYAGNFERAMSAWIVGVTDECAREAEILKLFKRDFPKGNPFEKLVEFRLKSPGDDGRFEAPCDLAPTPGRVNHNGVCLDKDTYRGRPGSLSPAYESVAIFLSRKPTQKELALLVQRALSFSDLPPKRAGTLRPKVTGCRLVREVTRIEVTPC